MSATYVVLRLPNPEQADALLRDIRAYEGGEAYVLTPTQENIVDVEVVSAYRDGMPYAPAGQCAVCGEDIAAGVCVTCGRTPEEAAEALGPVGGG